jgi:hypothetical protein
VIERMEGGEYVEEHRTSSYEEAFRAELHAFRRSVVDGAPVSNSVEEAYRDTLWIQAIAGAYRGKPVRL